MKLIQIFRNKMNQLFLTLNNSPIFVFGRTNHYSNEN